MVVWGLEVYIYLGTPTIFGAFKNAPLLAPAFLVFAAHARNVRRAQSCELCGKLQLQCSRPLSRASAAPPLPGCARLAAHAEARCFYVGALFLHAVRWRAEAGGRS